MSAKQITQSSLTGQLQNEISNAIASVTADEARSRAKLYLDAANITGDNGFIDQITQVSVNKLAIRLNAEIYGSPTAESPTTTNVNSTEEDNG